MLASRLRPALAVAIVTIVVAACDAGGSLRTPSPSPVVTPSNAPSATAGNAATASPRGTSLAWPAGWDDGFCTAYIEVVVAQELARDIGRALAEDATADAIGLARELQTTVGLIRPALAALPEWPAADAALAAIRTMLDHDEELATLYLRYLEENRQSALGRARDVEATLRDDAVLDVEDALDELADVGLACDGLAFRLEKPGSVE